MAYFSLGAMKANEAKLKEMLQYQSEARRHHEEMVRNVNSVLEQWNVDLAHSKDQVISDKYSMDNTDFSSITLHLGVASIQNRY
jgi:hypothetical protein